MKRLILITLLVNSFCVPVWASDGEGQTVVVIDNGFDKNHPIRYINRSACYSEAEVSNNSRHSNSTFPTVISRTDTTTTDIIYRNNIMSKCPNGRASDIGSNKVHAVNMPLLRKYRDVAAHHYLLNGNATTFLSSSFSSYFSDVTLTHGTNVAQQVGLFAPSANILPITVGNINRSRNCGISRKSSQRYNQASSDFYINYFDHFNQSGGCTDGIEDDQILDALKYVIRNPNGVIAVNISIGFGSGNLCSSQKGRNEVASLNSRGIAVIAAVGNTNGNNVEWPACLDNVIAVAQADGSGVVNSSIRDNKQDFFLSGSMRDYQTFNDIRGTSFAAPRLAGIYASLKSINPRASIADITNVLRNTGNSIGNLAGRRVNYTAAAAEIRNVTGTPPSTNPEPPTTSPTTDGVTNGSSGSSGSSGAATRPPTPVGQTAVLGFVDNALQSGAARYDIFLNGSPSFSVNESVNETVNQRALNPLNANIAVSDVRDIRLDFEGKYTSRSNPRDVPGMEIVINDIPRIVFNTVQPQGDGNSAVYRPHSFILNRNWFTSGANKIVIRDKKGPRQGASVWLERTRNVRMEYNAPLNMKFGQTINKLHGHSFGTKIHQTGLRVTFSGSQSDVDFSVTGFDIDTDTEVAVFLNHRRVGYLSRSGNAGYNRGNRFKFRKADLVSSGVNTIEFVNTSTSDREVWGVTNLKLDGAPPDISGIIMMLLSD